MTSYTQTQHFWIRSQGRIDDPNSLPSPPTLGEWECGRGSTGRLADTVSTHDAKCCRVQSRKRVGAVQQQDCRYRSDLIKSPRKSRVTGEEHHRYSVPTDSCTHPPYVTPVRCTLYVVLCPFSSLVATSYRNVDWLEDEHDPASRTSDVLRITNAVSSSRVLCYPARRMSLVSIAFFLITRGLRRRKIKSRLLMHSDEYQSY